LAHVIIAVTVHDETVSHHRLRTRCQRQLTERNVSSDLAFTVCDHRTKVTEVMGSQTRPAMHGAGWIKVPAGAHGVGRRAVAFVVDM
jgi:hypothetical protein